jgi:type 1 glutamine amidotransferase
MIGRSTVVALIGDRYHNSDYIRTALGKTLVRDLELTIDFTDEVQSLNSETLNNYRMLIIFRDAMIWPNGYDTSSAFSNPPLPKYENKPVHWMTKGQGQAVKDFVNTGGMALFYHNTTYIAAGSEIFQDVLGATTEGHPPTRPFKVRVTNPDHPIMQGVNDFIVTDEQHFMTLDIDPKFVFMESINEDGLTHQNMGASCYAGWAYDYGQGRVCYLAPGHTIAALWNPEYEKIQQNAVRWLMKQI